MNSAVFRVVTVGSGDAFRSARRDARLEMLRCEDALDALATAVATSPPIDALVFDHHAASHEDMARVFDAASEAGLPEPIVLTSRDDAETLYARIVSPAASTQPEQLVTEHAQAPPPELPEHSDAPSPIEHDDEAVEVVEALAEATDALLEGGSSLETLLERIASFGVRLESEIPAPHRWAHAPILDEEGDTLAYLAGPPALHALLPAIARLCASASRLDETFDRLVEDASTDPQTGLPDRVALLEELEWRIDQARPERATFTLSLARLHRSAFDDIEIAHDLIKEGSFGAIASWGVLGLVFDNEREPEAQSPVGPACDACVSVLYPWDGADAEALLDSAEALLHAMTRTDTV